MKNNKLHMIGHSHIDPAWLWCWQEGYHEVNATLRAALDLMEEFDDFVFVSSSVVFLTWLEESDPVMFEEIRQRVREGRWQLAGGWWVEPDCNIPCGESLVRQGLYGQRYLLERFGETANVGFNIDSFGHSAGLPQILKKSGLDYYVFMRPMAHEKDLPSHLFQWESDDGSQVLAYRVLFDYMSGTEDISSHIRRCADELQPPFDELMCFYGVGNHGGGPTRANLHSIHRADQDPDFPQVVCSSLEEYFKSLEGKGWDLPVLHSELQFHSRGCYAAHSEIKKLNREIENRLLTAEKWSVLAESINGQAYPQGLKQAWKDLLFNQAHDILPGTSHEAACQDARDTFGEARAIADRALNTAIQSFAWNVRIDKQEGVRPVVVFNPHTWQVQANVEMEADTWSAEAVLVDDNDLVIPHQEVQSTTVVEERARISFNVDLPPLG